MVPLAHLSHPPKLYLDWFSHFAELTNVTNRQTDRPRYSVCSNRPHLAVAVIQPKKLSILGLTVRAIYS